MRRPGRRAGTRSIPAHTGKPLAAAEQDAERKVYPRPHGEADAIRLLEALEDGLSPPTRGSPFNAPAHKLRQGSIPAHTGKPLKGVLVALGGGVYPRPHGEAEAGHQDDDAAQGLSPPTRGSRLRAVRALRRQGSIPAHTGKPYAIRRRPARHGVYPRPHGEAFGVQAVILGGSGLSPPTRGSPRPASAVRTCYRSIPAHTGKPGVDFRPTRRYGVYPRPHGEATPTAGATCSGRGLSPPTRGSPRLPRSRPGTLGSIPAHTGKPR